MSNFDFLSSELWNVRVAGQAGWLVATYSFCSEI